jgi:hypothetical protein
MGKAYLISGQLTDSSDFLEQAMAKALKLGDHHPEVGLAARACILFAWNALEAIVIASIRKMRSDLKQTGQRTSKDNQKKTLRRQLEILTSKYQVPFDAVLFSRLRDYRNRIAHGIADENVHGQSHAFLYTNPPVSSAKEHFDYCSKLGAGIYQDRLFYATNSPGPFQAKEVPKTT